MSVSGFYEDKKRNVSGSGIFYKSFDELKLIFSF